MSDEEQTQVLNFKARIISDYPEDRRRQFMVSYYLCDNTMAIFEANVPNSGFRAGKFLQRTRVRNPDTNKFFEAQAFYVGAKIRASGRIFELLDAAPHTFNLMEARSDEFPEANLENVICRLRDVLMGQTGDLRAAFEAKDPIKTGYVMRDEAEEILMPYAEKLTKHAIITLLRAYEDGNKYYYKPILQYIKAI